MGVIKHQVQDHKISEGHSITELLAANFQTPTSELWHSSRRESSPTAFWDMTNIKFEELYQYHLAKADIAASQQSIAILRRFDPASKRWKESFLNEFEVPNLEDPVSDGQFKKVFKNALFSSGF